MVQDDILAIDGSTKSTGFAIFSQGKLAEVWHKASASADLIKRIQIMRDELRTALSNPKYNIRAVVMEEVRQEGGARSVATFKALMWLQAAFVILIHDEFPKVKVIYTYPSTWRSQCGIKTGAGVKRETLKQADMRFVAEHYHPVANDDEADAVCIGHAHVFGKNAELNWD